MWFCPAVSRVLISMMPFFLPHRLATLMAVGGKNISDPKKESQKIVFGNSVFGENKKCFLVSKSRKIAACADHLSASVIFKFLG